jgi:CHAT domain-containing protein
MRQELSALDARIKGIDTRLATAFPQFAELSSPQPVSLVEAQALLAEDEALLTYLVWVDRSFVFVVRRDRVLTRQITLGAKELGEAVTALRKGLDPINVRTLADIPPFDTTRAFQLYRKLFQPVEHMLDGARHVFVVPDGALQSLPLGVLVTKESQGEFTDFSGYRQTEWLARKYAMTTLPSVSSLRALRSFAKPTKASRPFLGVGDPKLKGKTGSGRGVKLASLFTARGVADVDAVRKLASLPETAGELRSLARALGASDEALLLGTEATETRVKQARLEDYKVLAFATHGLVAGALTGLSEPALVLTPPAKGTEQDDGLLTASEVAQLKLDADWVILSACNTAAADGTPGAEGLSGLAKAFFYAGGRALLVSHWPVTSDAAVRITTRMLEEARKPGVGRAEAHRRAMLALIDDKDRPHYAHPLFWAPFVVVGEGGSAGSRKSP